MSGPLIAELSTEELWAEIACHTAALMRRTTSINVYPTSGKMQINFGEGADEVAEQLSMLLEDYDRRCAEIGGVQ